MDQELPLRRAPEAQRKDIGQRIRHPGRKKSRFPGFGKAMSEKGALSLFNE
jgi:hypothetical protein